MSRPAVASLPPGLIIRPERAADADEIGRLHDAAFDDPQVAPLVVAIRESPQFLADLSLVTVLADETIIGHVMVSRTDLVRDGDGATVDILMLSPLGVLPALQGRGVGMALTHAALAIADQRPEPLMIVQGHPTYYPRFGFVRGRTVGVLPPEHLGAIDQAWMVRRRPGAPDVRGRVVYPPAFLELDA
jgi:putative acetyltransferase